MNRYNLAEIHAVIVVSTHKAKSDNIDLSMFKCPKATFLSFLVSMNAWKLKNREKTGCQPGIKDNLYYKMLQLSRLTKKL